MIGISRRSLPLDIAWSVLCVGWMLFVCLREPREQTGSLLYWSLHGAAGVVAALAATSPWRYRLRRAAIASSPPVVFSPKEPPPTPEPTPVATFPIPDDPFTVVERRWQAMPLAERAAHMRDICKTIRTRKPR